jgi:outer membrane protein assembly factor BamB
LEKEMVMRYRRFLLCSVLMFVLFLAGCDGGTDPDGDGEDPLEVVWTYQTEGAVRNRPVRIGTYVLFGSDDGTVYCLREADGSVYWTFPSGGPVRTEVNNYIVDYMYFGTDFGRLYCLRAGPPDLLWWSYDAGAPVRTTPFFSGSLVYFADTEGDVYCLEAGDGDEVWTTQVPDGVESDPYVDADRVYLGCDDGSVYALDDETGEVLWSYATGGPVTAPVGKTEERIIIGSQDGCLYSLDPADGSLAWRYDAGSAIRGGTQKTYGEDAVYVGTDDGRMLCVNLDGTLRSEFDSGAAITGMPRSFGPVTEVVFGNHAGTLFKVDGGEEVWRMDVTDTPIQGSPANYGDTVYVGADDGVVYRLDAVEE